MLTKHGELIKDSGLENILSNIAMSIIGTGGSRKSYQTGTLLPSSILVCTVFKIKRCERQIRFDVKFFRMA